MPQVDVYKLHNIASVVEIAKYIDNDLDFTKILQGHAQLNKRDKESDGAAFERILTAPTSEGVALRKEYARVSAKSFPNEMSTEPMSVEVGDTSVSDDSWKAAEQLAALVEEQFSRAPWMTKSKLYEAVYADPTNKALVARAHRRPAASSTSGK